MTSVNTSAARFPTNCVIFLLKRTSQILHPLQCSYLENPRDGGALWAAVYGVAQSRTLLKRLSKADDS